MAETKIDRSEPHFRIYDHRTEGPVVVCVQDFDYPDYDEARFLPGAWLTEAEAEEALADREAVVPHIGHLDPHAMAAYLFPSAVAAAESRGRAAGYADAVRALAFLVEANYHPASSHGVLLRSVVARMEKFAAAASAPSATTEEPTP